MEDGLLSLKWNNHKSTFFHILSGLRKKETYTDATLACEGKFFPVHKLVMSTCSDYFGEVFERTTCKSPVVILKDIRHHDLEALLDYMYLGEVDVKQSELAGLIKAAECLRIKGLAVPDEDPSLSTKKSMPVPEGRRGGSPAAKRPRRESGGSDGGSSSSSQYHSYGSGSLKGVRRSVSPTGSSASSRSHPQSIATSTSVPSQSAMAAPAAPDALHSQVPPRAMLPPSPAVTDLPPLHPSDGGGGGDSHRNPPDQNFVPVDMIKVEVEDEGNHHHPGNSQPLRHPDSAPDSGKGRDEPRGEGGGGEDDSSDGGRGPGKHPMANSFSDYGSHTGEIEKEEHDQIDAYNGSEQLAGPSGVQGAPQMMNWGEEEGNFPHNLFGGEDSSHQQVLTQYQEKTTNTTTDLADFKDSDYEPHRGWNLSGYASAFSRGGGTQRSGTPVYYSCPICPKGFTDKYKWTRHIVTHTGEKPFACPVCPCRYTRNDKLKEHLRRVHRIK